MPKVTSEVSRIRRRVYAEVARLAFADRLEQNVDGLPQALIDAGITNYRCCEFKEKAILTERVKLAMGIAPVDEQVNPYWRLSEVARYAMEGPYSCETIIHVLDAACDRCPIDKIVVTNACRNCVAHRCRNACPKDAIQIIQNQAFIDKNKCVECGLCARACQYGAILQVERPCERACQVGAVQPGENRNATIDTAKCIECGACVQACPFGAISDVSQILPVIQGLKSGRQVWAMLAPSFPSQFGPTVSPEQLISGLRELGFAQVMEVGIGADIVVRKEAREFAETVGTSRPAMTSSCCPGFVNLVDKHFPNLTGLVSHIESPMLEAARWARQHGADIVVFVGPCIAKKGEALRKGQGLVDHVLTFEELTAMFVAKGINLADQPRAQGLLDSTWCGRIFAVAGGLTRAMEETLNTMAETFSGHPPKLQGYKADGAGECQKALKALEKGAGQFNFLEGMACQGGCVGGPGCVVDERIGRRGVEKFSEASRDE